MHPHIFLEILNQTPQLLQQKTRQAVAMTTETILFYFCFVLLKFYHFYLFFETVIHAYNVFWSYPSPILSLLLDSPPTPSQLLVIF